MYIETSAPRRRGQAARLWTPSFTAANGQCLTFWYNMYGRSVGTLNIYAAQNGTQILGQPIFSLSGNQGNKWQQEQIALPNLPKMNVSMKVLKFKF